MKRKILVAAAVGLGTLLVGLVAFLFWIDSIARQGIETATSLALRVPTHLESATLRFSGRATLGRFTISNPERYKEAEAASFENFDATLDPRSLLEDVVEIDQLVVLRPKLTVEFIGLRSNWSILMANLAATRSREARDRENDSRRRTGKNFRIRRLRVEEATVRFRSNLLPVGSHVLKLLPFELKNLGSVPGGASTAEVLTTLFLAMAGQAITGGEHGLPAQLLGAFQTEVSKTAQEIRDTIAAGAGALREVEQGLERDLQHIFIPNR